MQKLNGHISLGGIFRTFLDDIIDTTSGQVTCDVAMRSRDTPSEGACEKESNLSVWSPNDGQSCSQ